MATYIKVQNIQYPASITGRLHDGDWDDRASKAIRLEMSYADALSLFVDDVQWSILQDMETFEDREEEMFNEETGETEVVTTTVPVTILEEYDNSEYSIAGDIIDHRDGTVTVKMGKLTAEELFAMVEEVL